MYLKSSDLQNTHESTIRTTQQSPRITHEAPVISVQCKLLDAELLNALSGSATGARNLRALLQCPTHAESGHDWLER